jgi:hypothetical protein
VTNGEEEVDGGNEEVHGNDVGEARTGTGAEWSGVIIGYYEEAEEAGAAEKKVRVVMTCDTTQRYVILSHVECIDNMRFC